MSSCCELYPLQPDQGENFVLVTHGVVLCIISANSSLLKMMKGKSIVPKRATSRQRSSVLNILNLNNYIKILHAQGKVKWACFVDIPVGNISDMDEVSTNVHNHRRKFISSSTHLEQLFQELNDRDSKI